MRKDITKPETKTVETCIGREVICDICGERLGRNLFDKRRGKAYDYFRVTTGHHDWGNDSIDSIEHRDVCTKCLYTMFNEYLIHTKGENNSNYIDIEHEFDVNTDEEE